MRNLASQNEMHHFTMFWYACREPCETQMWQTDRQTYILTVNAVFNNVAWSKPGQQLRVNSLTSNVVGDKYL